MTTELSDAANGFGFVQRLNQPVVKLAAETGMARDLANKPVAAFELPVAFTALTKGMDGTTAHRVKFQPVVMVMNGLRFKRDTHRFEGTLAAQFDRS